MRVPGSFSHTTSYVPQPGGGTMTVTRSARAPAGGGASEAKRPFHLTLTASGTGTATAKVEYLSFVTSFGVRHVTPGDLETAVVSGDVLWAKIDTTDWSAYALFVGDPAESDTADGAYYFMPLYEFGGDPNEPVTVALDLRFTAIPVWS